MALGSLLGGLSSEFWCISFSLELSLDTLGPDTSTKGLPQRVSGKGSLKQAVTDTYEMLASTGFF